MDNKKVTILHIVAELNSGGVESMLYNYYTNINRDKIQFNFIVFGDEIGYFEQKFVELGSQIYHIPHKEQGLIKCIKCIYKMMKQNNNKNTIIHSHRGEKSGIFLAIAWIAKYKVRVAHAHHYKNKLSKIEFIKYKILSNITKIFATDYFACGSDAGRWLYGKAIEKNNMKVINNAIDINKYTFNENIRKNKRIELGLSDKYIIGNIARFTNQKNHDFLIDIFYDIYKKDNDAVLLLIGNGENELKIKSKVKKLGLEDRVMFLGVRNDITELLQAMDILVLPSRFEGLPVVLVEAQASGLPCLVSENITREIQITDEINYLYLDDSIDNWSNNILKYKENPIKRVDNRIKDDKYNVGKSAKFLELEYKNLIKK